MELWLKFFLKGERSADQPDVKGWGGLGTTSGGFSRPEQVRLMISPDWSRCDTDYEDGENKARQSFSMISMMDKCHWTMFSKLKVEKSNDQKSSHPGTCRCCSSPRTLCQSSGSSWRTFAATRISSSDDRYLPSAIILSTSFFSSLGLPSQDPAWYWPWYCLMGYWINYWRKKITIATKSCVHFKKVWYIKLVITCERIFVCYPW